MRQFGLVFAYSLKERLRSKAFTYMTLVMILLVAAIVWIPKLLDDGGNAVEGEVAVLDTTGLITSTDGLKELVSSSYDWRLIQPGDLQQEINQVSEKGDVLGVIQIEEAANAPVLTVTVNKRNDAPYLNVLNGYVQNLYSMSEMNKLSLSQEELSRLTTPLQLELKELDSGGKAFEDTYFPIYLITFMLYLLIYLFGGNVAVSVSVEKGSRVKEILITKVKPLQLLFGKILGVGLAGMIQFGLIVGASYLLITTSGSGNVIQLGGMKLDFSVLDGKTIALLCVFFVLGYFFYAALFAAVGSLVNRSEEVNQAIMPVSMLMMAALVIAFVAMGNPEGSLAVIGSYIPLATPFAMFVRVGMSEPTTMEIVIPTVILFVSTIGACWLSAKIYQLGVLLYGQKPTFKLLMKAISSSSSKGGKKYGDQLTKGTAQ